MVVPTAPQEGATRAEVEFSTDYTRYIEQVGRELRERNPQFATIEGYVSSFMESPQSPPLSSWIGSFQMIAESGSGGYVFDCQNSAR